MAQSIKRAGLLIALTSLFVAAQVVPQAENNQSAPRPSTHPLQISVVDENGLVVPLAQVRLENIATGEIRQGETDTGGRWLVPNLPLGSYRVHVEKQGFYTFDQPNLQLGEAAAVEIGIHHQQEVGEVVDVVDAVPTIDPQQTAKSETLTSRDITDIPYPSTRDIRNVFPFIPGVIQDTSGQLHVAGAPSYNVRDVLDGFNITEPASGEFQLRLSPEAVRRLEVESSRYSAQYGGAAGGLLVLDTHTGDDHFRFSAVNFIPTVQNVHGFNLNNWTPRATFGGPIVKQRAWFYLAHESEFDLNIIKELPRGADRTHLWRTSDVAKFQANLTPGNVLTTEFVGNLLNTPAAGLDPLNPMSITRQVDDSAYLVSVKDQAYLSRSALLEVGAAVMQFRESERPQGIAPEVLQPGGNSGNYFRSSLSHSRRVQALANLYLPPVNWHGRHEFRVGMDADHVNYDQTYQRNTVLALRTDGTLARQITFTPNVAFSQNNSGGGLYVQDRWAIGDRVMIEPGLRADWDQIVHDMVASPRVAASILLTPTTKLSFGAGVFHNSTTLRIISQPFNGQRFDTFYDANGIAVGPPVVTQFRVGTNALKAPESVNWSVGFERKFPGGLYGRVEFVNRDGLRDFTYDSPAVQAGGAGGIFDLTSTRRDVYHSAQFTVRRDFENHHAILISYTRSKAHTNDPLIFSFDNLLFGRQSPGPLPWDAPNRAITWGFLRIPKTTRWDFAYSAEWRTGFPFNVVNDQQQLVGRPNQQRFPYYFSLNTHIERRFRFRGYLWAIRVGMDDATGRRNPVFVDNNINSPTFLTFSGFRGRTFNGRIRFLGKEAAP